MSAGKLKARTFALPECYECALSGGDVAPPRRDLEQILRLWYVFFFQLPWLPEAGMQADDWRSSGDSHFYRR